MRITIDILHHGVACITPAQEREYRLRGLRIPVIENLGIIGDAYEALNLSNNSIATLGGFPRLEMVQSLILNNNQIKRIQRGLGTFLPNLKNLILVNNTISSLLNLEPLGDLPKLERLALVGNPVTKEQGYRLYVINKCPKVRVLDFSKVTLAERTEARRIYGGAEEDQPNEFVVGEKKGDFTVMTDEQRNRIMEVIKITKSMEEVDKLEQMLQTGKIPSTFEFATKEEN